MNKSQKPVANLSLSEICREVPASIRRRVREGEILSWFRLDPLIVRYMQLVAEGAH